MRKLIGFAAAAATVLSLGLAGVSTAKAAPPSTSTRDLRPAADPVGAVHRPHAARVRSPVRLPGRAARLRAPEGTKIKLAVSRVLHKTPDSEYQGVMLVNPGGPGGSGLIYSIVGDLHPERGRRRLRLDRLRPPRRRLQPARARVHGTLRRRASAVRPRHGRPRQWVARVEGLRLRPANTADGRAVQPREDDRHGRGHGEPAIALGQQQDQLLRVLLRHVPRPGVRHAAPRPGPAVRLRQHRRPARRLVPEQPGPGHRASRRRSTSTSAGSPSTATCTTSATPARGRTTLPRHPGEPERRPIDGTLGGDELPDVFTRAGYYVYGWEDIARPTRTYLARRRPTTSSTCTTTANPTTPGADNGYAIYLGTQCTDAPWPRSQAS